MIDRPLAHWKKTATTAYFVSLLLVPQDARADLPGYSGLEVTLECIGNYARSQSDWECPTINAKSANAASTAVLARSSEGFAPQKRTNAAGAAAHASYGRIGAIASAFADSQTPLGSLQPHTPSYSDAVARAKNYDLITMNSATLNRQAGSMQVVVDLSGNLTALSTGIAIGTKSRDEFNSNVLFNIEAFSEDLKTKTGRAKAEADLYVDSDGVLYRGDRFPKQLVMTIPFVWGQPFWLSMSMRASAYSEVSAPGISVDDPLYQFPRTGSSSASFEHTASLGGIRNVLTGGQAVTVWTVASQSGADYTRNFATVVPEPKSYALLMAGLGFIAFVSRRKMIKQRTAA
ncbi:MAG: PEP-CTERM sorting domain-containing protein [Rhodoferax sp.]|nr:PEP-CTERM sorting domain-containing protein [Rhodoferax sp.]